MTIFDWYRKLNQSLVFDVMIEFDDQIYFDINVKNDELVANQQPFSFVISIRFSTVFILILGITSFIFNSETPTNNGAWVSTIHDFGFWWKNRFFWFKISIQIGPQHKFSNKQMMTILKWLLVRTKSVKNFWLFMTSSKINEGATH